MKFAPRLLTYDRIINIAAGDDETWHVVCRWRMDAGYVASLILLRVMTRRGTQYGDGEWMQGASHHWPGTQYGDGKWTHRWKPHAVCVCVFLRKSGDAEELVDHVYWISWLLNRNPTLGHGKAGSVKAPCEFAIGEDGSGAQMSRRTPSSVGQSRDSSRSSLRR